MFRRIELIDENGIGTVMVYDTEADAIACMPPLRQYTVTATAAPGQSQYDALLSVMVAQDLPA